MNAVCSERMPLQASSTFTHEPPTWIRLPWASAGCPSSVMTSAQIRALPRMRDCTR